MARVLLAAAVICLISSEHCIAWIYHGCYLDKSDRHLETWVATVKNMTIQKCIQMCSYRGFFYAGPQCNDYCFCGNHIKPAYQKFDDKECSSTCSGDANQKCGGFWRASIYSTYKYEGCYADNSSSRILEGPSSCSTLMTSDMCINQCKDANKVFAMTQYSTECYCGNSLKPSEKKPDTECNHTCSGAPTEYCGGYMRGSLYRV